MQVKATDLKLGDTVQLFDGAFGSAVVTQIADGLVHLFRPYAITADFSYTGGAIPYVGTETVKLTRNSDAEYNVLARKEIH